ncbi:MAG: hypothetical protein IT536_08570 [Hyphomicrobiales bacterium]|nr:hypothetical protein [Hyphomicrobiales bacterium]
MVATDSPLLFDKLRYLDRLKSAGIGEDQARAHAEAIEDALRESVATKADLLRVENSLQSMEQRLTSGMQAMEYRLMVRGGLMAAAVVAILSSLKFFG